MQVFDVIVQAIPQSSERLRPYTIGVSGIDAAGKSSFSRELAQYLRQRGYHVVLVHLDDFHNPRHVRRGCGEPAPECYYRYTFDFDKLIGSILEPMRELSQLECQLTLLDLATDQYTVVRQYCINPKSVVIVEGVFLFQERLLPYFDLRVFIQISFDECLRRAVKRDVKLFGGAEEVVRRYRAKYIPGQQLHMERDQPLQKTDLTITSCSGSWFLAERRMNVNVSVDQDCSYY